MSSYKNVDELLRAAESHHDQYIKHLRALHEALAKNIAIPSAIASSQAAAVKMERSGSSPASSPALRAITFAPPAGTSKRPRRMTNDGPNDSSTGLLLAAQSAEAPPVRPSSLSDHGARWSSDGPGIRPSSVFEGIAAGSENDPEEFDPSMRGPTRTWTIRMMPPESFVTRPIKRETFTEYELERHLAELDSTNTPETTVEALGDVWTQRKELRALDILDEFDITDGPYKSSTYEVYEVQSDGTPVPQHTTHHHMIEDGVGGIEEASSVWDTLKDVNPSKTSVGRMTILGEPSPLTLAAAHKTFKDHFDMDELYRHLVSTNGNEGKTRAFMNRAFESKPLHQRTFFFVFKYYTVLGKDLKPAPWQAHDSRPADHRSPDHIDITECSSILALSLDGDPVDKVNDRVRRRVVRQGKLYDTLAPWHLLNIQCFPDEFHTVRHEDSMSSLCNGPHAFLDALSIEYRDAVKRYQNLNQMITKLITPPNQFMFDPKLRDKLLFEDAAFTYSRRYFWAYNTLGVVNDGISAMLSAYESTFTEKFWSGQHTTLWPHPSLTPAEYLAGPHAELKAALSDLVAVQKRNKRTRDEIASLRDQLFAGSSVKESRRAIEQGQNIKILTNVAMVFLPLTFVTSVFGIQTFTIRVEDWQFMATMLGVCIPFFVLILVLQTRPAMEMVRKWGRAVAGAGRGRVYGLR
ncbi:hypothetical protein QBC39DRAFT_372136 [Podospora conica]|nr:hypothetical protein QBC39DRAFT_372136 [Schizothecium conicum]